MARTPALQLPYVKNPADRTGRRLFRVQVLPKARVEHPSAGDLDFTGDRLRGLADRFRAGAYDIVPFVLADAANRHTDDPERFRGEVKGLELADDGLYATVETTDRGAQVLADNPRLPVSVRVVTPTTGDFKGQEVLAHVCGTLDPVVKGMRPWEAIEASGEVEVTDLSDGAWGEAKGLSGERSRDSTVAKDGTDTKGTDALSDEERGTFATLLGKLGFGKTDEGKDDSKDKDDAPDLSDEEVNRILDAFVDDATGDDTDKETDKEPVTATLSEDDRKTLDMANERADKADIRTGKTELSNRFSQLIRDGVPPASVEAARKELVGDSDRQKQILIDFANDRDPVEVKAVLAALEPLKGTVEFTEKGTSAVDEDSEEAKKAEKQIDATVDGWV